MNETFNEHYILLILLFHMAVQITRLEENGQPPQTVGNKLIIKMVQRGNWRIKVKHKSNKMSKCLTQIHSNKLVSIKLYFSLCPFNGNLPFVLTFLLLRNFFDIWTYLEISSMSIKGQFGFSTVNWQWVRIPME